MSSPTNTPNVNGADNSAVTPGTAAFARPPVAPTQRSDAIGSVLHHQTATGILQVVNAAQTFPPSAAGGTDVSGHVTAINANTPTPTAAPISSGTQALIRQSRDASLPSEAQLSNSAIGTSHPGTAPRSATAALNSASFIASASSTGGPYTNSERSISLLAVSDSAELFSWDSGRALVPQHPLAQGLRSDLAPQIARQLVEVMAQAAHRPIEIALSPQELGRVRMSIMTEDGAITVNIVAERPETLDLMRRHVDQLGQSFRNMGYDSITFSFGSGTEGSGTQDREKGSENGTAGTPSGTASQETGQAIDPASTTIHLNSDLHTGVDIRL